MRSIELFAGAGGLALGVSWAGFKHLAVIERDKPTCHTIRMNQQSNVPFVKDWPLYDSDIRRFDYATLQPPIDLLAGGPPCQPFSMGGKHRGYADERDMFPEAIRAVRELRPQAFLFENVKGLLRSTFSQYFSYIQLQLSYPEIISRSNESWLDHLARLEQHHTSSSSEGLNYRVLVRLINAADYGVPQRRERVFIVGFRSDLNREWSFPLPTHSFETLLYDQWIDKTYWDRHNIAPYAECTINLSSRMKKINNMIHITKPWRTIRDSIANLPDPEIEMDNIFPNHEFRPGARVYKGHTGSSIDLPAKTLKAGDHGVPGGENMLVFPSGKVRYFTVRESARLQSFPDTYIFPNSWTESMRQLGNAVPVDVAHQLAKSIFDCLK